MASSKNSEFLPQNHEFCDEMEMNSNEEYEEDYYEEYKMKEISVDPVSLKHPAPAPAPAPAVFLPFIKPKFISSSLPSSSTSSPLNFKRHIIPKQKYHPAFHSSLTRQHSVTQLNNKGMFLFRSKSCGDGRSSEPSAEFDILSRRHKNGGALITERSSNRADKVNYPQFREDEEELKCGAVCLFLPGLAKKKHAQAQLQRKASQEVKDGDDDDVDDEKMESRRAMCLFLPGLAKKKHKQAQLRLKVSQDGDDDVVGYIDVDYEKEESRSVMLSVASFEKFECGSWSSAILLDDDDDEEGDMSTYFDLPLELIRGSGEDPHLPVKTAFVFDSEPKGVLKKNTRKSHESNRHVRFSTPLSYPTSPSSGCITPRLLQAREEFNALIQAENAYINF